MRPWRLTAAAISWLTLISGMAILDDLAPSTEFRVSAWLFGLYIGVVMSFNLLLEDRDQATGMSLIFIGGLLSVYNIVWQATFLATGGQFQYPVNLWPFGFDASIGSWILMIGVGFTLIWLGAGMISRHK